MYICILKRRAVLITQLDKVGAGCLGKCQSTVSHCVSIANKALNYCTNRTRLSAGMTHKRRRGHTCQTWFVSSHSQAIQLAELINDKGVGWERAIWTNARQSVRTCNPGWMKEKDKVACEGWNTDEADLSYMQTRAIIREESARETSTAVSPSSRFPAARCGRISLNIDNASGDCSARF